MKALLLILVLIPFAFSRVHPVNQEVVDMIKQSGTTWTPMQPEKNPFYYMPIEKIKAMMGTKLEVDDSPNTRTSDSNDLPEYFDARDKWGSSIHPIRNQGQCGSCWAFGATEAFSDRLAISGTDVILSPQHLVSCDNNNMGCNGGYLSLAWIFMKDTGVVSDECYPYTSGDTQKDGDCFTACQDGSEWKTHHVDLLDHPKDEISIRLELYENGPVEAAFTVYEDFMSYQSGIYQHVTGELLGGHAIKFIGWGNIDGTDYWLMANSWGEDWGDRGFFKIKVGDCGINGNMYAGPPAKESA